MTETADLDARYGPRLRAELEDLKAVSDNATQDRRPVELDQQGVGRLSRMAAMQGQAMAASVNARGKAVQAALLRLHTGEFGWCDECGEFIGLKRLDLDPTLVRCVACAS